MKDYDISNYFHDVQHFRSNFIQMLKNKRKIVVYRRCYEDHDYMGLLHKLYESLILDYKSYYLSIECQSEDSYRMTHGPFSDMKILGIAVKIEHLFKEREEAIQKDRNESKVHIYADMTKEEHIALKRELENTWEIMQIYDDKFYSLYRQFLRRSQHHFYRDFPRTVKTLHEIKKYFSWGWG